MTSPRTAAPSLPSARITADQFYAFCLSYLSYRDRLSSRTTTTSSSELSWLTYATQWEWQPPLFEGRAFECTACLNRSFSCIVRSVLPSAEQGEELWDQEPLEMLEQTESAVQVVTIHQSISYSNIWSLPILHFSAHTDSGQPVPLHLLTRYRILHSTPTLQQQHHHLQPVTPISVADHPRTGLPTYYLHPCNTEAALSQVLRQATLVQHDNTQQSNDERSPPPPHHSDLSGWTYISAFVNICASAVEMRAS